MLFVVLGTMGLFLSFWGLWRDIGFIAQPFYAWVWWSYLLLLDGVVKLRRGESLFTARRTLLLPLFFWSTTFWFGFELLNLRLQNWYYVGVFARGDEVDIPAGTLYGALCFATVLTAIFETHDVLDSFGLFRKLHMRPRRLPPWLSYVVQALGALLLGVALVFPTYLAPLVWGSLSLVVDPWNYRRGARSLLSDVEEGRVDFPLRLVAAGLMCGLAWETFNFLAPQKWIYTIRGLEDLKLFEMPVVGFLGFPALALDAFAAFAAACYWLHGNETWEAGVAPPLRKSRRHLFHASLPLHAGFWYAVSLLIVPVNVASIELRLDHIESLSKATIPRLEDVGIRRPRQLLAALEDPATRASLPVEEAERPAVMEEAELLLFKGVGYHHGRYLRRAGVETLRDLAEAEPLDLFGKLERIRGGDPFPPLRRGMVRVWVNAARESLARSR